MPNNGNDQKSKSVIGSGLHSFLASADTQSRALAKSLDKNRTIYPIWSLLDSLSSSYSMWRYWAELFLTSDPDAMQEFMKTPGAIIGITCETLFLVSISFLASLYEKKENNGESIQLVVNVSPYVREIIKGLKNAYKGWRSTAIAITVLGSQLTQYIIPLGIGIGIMAAIIRSLLLKLKENRKAMMTANLELIKKVKELSKLSASEKSALEESIKEQDWKIELLGYLGVSLNGLIDGMYLYVGVLSLAALVPPLLASMLIICAIYTAACVAVRNYEHYDFELKLSITQTQAHLLLSSKELETCFNQLCIDKAKLYEDTADPDPEALKKIVEAENRICLLINEFEARRRLLIKQSTPSYSVVILQGIKNALSAYSALTSFVFLLSTIIILSSSTMPPALLITTIVLGIAFIIGYVAQAVYEKHQLSKLAAEQSGEQFNPEKLKNLVRTKEPEITAFEHQIDLGLTVAAAPVSCAADVLEVVRSGCSGAGKGEKFVEFIGLQEQVRAGHPHESPIIWVVDACCALFFSIVMGLRALAKAFGREPLGKIDLIADRAAPPTKQKKENPPLPSEATKVPEKLKEEGKTQNSFEAFIEKTSKLVFSIRSKKTRIPSNPEIEVTRLQTSEKISVPTPNPNAKPVELVIEDQIKGKKSLEKPIGFSYGVTQKALDKVILHKTKLPISLTDNISKPVPILTAQVNHLSRQNSRFFRPMTTKYMKTNAHISRVVACAH